MTGSSEITCMQDAIPIHEQKLRPKLCRFQSVKQDRVHWNLLKGQESGHVGIVSRLLLIIFIDYFHVRVTEDQQCCHSVALASFTVADVNSADQLNCVGLVLIDSPVEIVGFNQLLLQFILDVFPLRSDLRVDLVLHLVKL